MFDNIVPVAFPDRKKRVKQTTAEVSKVANEVFRRMTKNGEKFPIGLAFRGLGNYYNEAQNVLPSDRINGGLTTADRKSFISKLNYRHKCASEMMTEAAMLTSMVSPTPTPVPTYSGPCHDPVAPTASPTPLPQLVEEGLSPTLAAAVVEMATLVRDYISKDKDAMKLFTATLLGLGK
jgi:hypothetical protein